MSNPENDSRLEQLSREAADRYTVKAFPSWEQMEKELDKVLPTEKKKKRPFLFWWIIPGVLMIGFTLWYSMNTQTAKQATSPSLTAQNGNHQEPITQNPTQTIEEKEKIAPVSSISDAQLQSKELTDTKQQKPSSFRETRNSTTEQQQEIASPLKNVQQSFNTLSLQKDTTVSTTGTSSSFTENTEFIGSAIDTGNNVAHQSIHTTKDSTPVSIMNVQEHIIVPDKDPLAPKNKEDKSAFSWALVAGIDATTVKFRYADKASLSGGIIIGYHLNRNWSIHTGTLYTRKSS